MTPVLRLSASQRLCARYPMQKKYRAEAQSFLGLPATGVRDLKGGGSNWESTTLAPAYAARPKASVDIPSWRLARVVRR